MFGKLIVLSIVASALALAQGGGGGGEDMGGMGGGGGRGSKGGDMGASLGGGGQARKQTKLELIVEKLKLNKEQKEQFDTILSAGREKGNPLRPQLQQARVAIATAMIDKKSDDEIKKAIEAYSSIQAQMVTVETEAYTKVYALLKPNQQSKAPQAFELMAGLFDPAAPQGRGGGGMGRSR